ncbi:hypothetical protein BJY01DRAFT_222027 [Aspergillus pseudoustus]|uniref:Uncharacterized protein n=1 Tax=Aspergillus pseudoustus TaxID=1810923 RepID=A0ABR4J8I1_9EURO
MAWSPARMALVFEFPDFPVSGLYCYNIPGSPCPDGYANSLSVGNPWLIREDETKPAWLDTNTNERSAAAFAYPRAPFMIVATCFTPCCSPFAFNTLAGGLSRCNSSECSSTRYAIGLSFAIMMHFIRIKSPQHCKVQTIDLWQDQRKSTAPTPYPTSKEQIIQYSLLIGAVQQ